MKVACTVIKSVVFSWHSSCFIVLCRCQQLAAEGILLLGCSCLWTQFLTNRLWEFKQIYTSSAVGWKDELVWFWGQKVIGQALDKTKYGQKSTLGIWRSFIQMSESETTFLVKPNCSMVRRQRPSSLVFIIFLHFAIALRRTVLHVSSLIVSGTSL